MWVRPEPVESCVRFGCQGTVWISKPGYAPLTLLPEQSFLESQLQAFEGVAKVG